MEYLMHTCGAMLARHEHGGIAGSVVYGEPSPTGRELHACSQCAEPIADADLYRVEHTAVETLLTALDGRSRLAFPFHWSSGGRAYTYRSRDSERQPRAEHHDRAGWQTTGLIGLPDFTRWMEALEVWQAD